MSEGKTRLTARSAKRIRSKVQAVLAEEIPQSGYEYLSRLKMLGHALAEPYGKADEAFIKFRDLRTKDIKWLT